MNKYFTLLAFVFFTGFSFAQNNTGTIVMEIESAIVQPGDSVCLNVNGSGFSDVLGMQFSMSWDPDVLQFEDVVGLNLPGMSSSDFGLRFIDEGELTFAYIAPTGQMLPDAGNFFSVCFRATGPAGSSTSVKITSSPTAVEFVGEIDNLAQVITNYSLIGGTVHIPDSQGPSEPLSLNVTSDPISNCLIDGVAQITVAAAGGQSPYMYTWTGPGGLVASGASMTPLREGVYHLQVTDAQGGQLESSFSIFESDLTITGADATDASCTGLADGQVSVSATGGKGDLSYLWNTGDTGEALNGVTSGEYRVTISDMFGCATTQQLTVGAGPGVTINPQATAPTCGAADGAVTLNASSPDGNLNYNWSDGGDGDARSGLTPGTYAVTVTDAKGCSATDNFDFSWDPLSATLSTDCGPDDTNQINYSAVSSAQGGVGPYSFDWSTGFEEQQVQQSSLMLPGPGTYTLTITDAEGCTETAQIDVSLCGQEAPVWPGDTDNDQVVTHFDLLPIGLGFDEQGPVREQASLNWNAQAAVFWGETPALTGIDLKYADADGNGRIEAADTLAIAQHWGQSHDGGVFTPQTSPSSEELSLFVEPATVMLGELAAFNIMLGENGGQPVSDAYGLAFQIVYDPVAILPESVDVSFAGSWLGDPGTELLTLARNRPDANRIDIALTRTDQSGRSGSGAIAQIVLQISETMPPGSDGSYDLPFRIEQLRLTDTENLIAVSPMETTATLMLPTSINDPALQRQIRLFPNPAGDFLRIESGELQLRRIDLMLPNGQTARSWTDRDRLELDSFPAGTYWVRIIMDEGVVTRKLIIAR